MDLLPPRISNPALLGLAGEILAPPAAPGTETLRLRLLNDALSWQELIDLAEAQDILVPLIWALRQRSLLLPLPTGAAAWSINHPTLQLTARYEQHLARRRRQRDQLLGARATLNRQGIAPLIMKGARYLLAPAGSWAEAREMRDIDLLVHPKDAERAFRALEGDGYAADLRWVPTDQHLPEFWHPAHPSVIEIHTEALAFSARKTLSTDEVWRRAVPAAIEHPCSVLPAEWQLLHGLLHDQISDRGHARKTLALKPLWGLAMQASELSDEAWSAIAQHMAMRGQADVLGSFVMQAVRLFHLPCPPVEISPAARAHAEATLAHAQTSEWRRWPRALADQLGFAFSRETLAARYRLNERDVSLRTWARHCLFLLRHYQGRILNRLFGVGGRSL